MKEIIQVKYEVVADFEDNQLKWVLDTLKEATKRFNDAKKYKGLKDLKCNEIQTIKVNLF